MILLRINFVISFGSYIAYGNESNLRDMEPIHLVERACRTLRKNYWESEETSLNKDEYYLDRAFVEVMELRKEKSVACQTDVLPRVCLKSSFMYLCCLMKSCFIRLSFLHLVCPLLVERALIEKLGPDLYLPHFSEGDVLVFVL